MDFVRIYDNVLSAQECESLMDVFNKHPSVVDGRTGAGVDKSKKDSKDLTLDFHPDLTEWKSLLLRRTFEHLQQYIAEYPQTFIGAVAPTVLHPETQQPVTLTLDNFAELGMPHLAALSQNILRSGIVNVQKYQKGVGGYPYWHSEIYPQDQRCEPLHRILFYLYYLNDVDEGGETEFYLQKQKIKPKAGRLVIAPAGFTHTHRGNTPISNDKYVVASWVMFNRAEVLYGQPNQ